MYTYSKTEEIIKTLSNNCLFGTSVRKTSIATPSQFVGIEGVELGTVDKVLQHLLFTSSTKRIMILAFNLSLLTLYFLRVI